MTDLSVAPRVGAWNEIDKIRIRDLQDAVAPRVGAWIEISRYADFGKGLWSLPVWERGLKSKDILTATIDGLVAPRVGAWIEIRKQR